MGVKVTVAGSYGLDMNAFDFSTIYYGDHFQTSSSLFRVYYSSGAIEEFRGKGFKYDAYGEPTAGVVSSYAAFYGGQKILTLDGASITAASIVKAAATYSTSDDRKLISAELNGSDRLSGGNLADKLYGYGGNDILAGKAGNDYLRGGAGNDKIDGGIGRDALYGESGSDTFIFRNVKDSTVASTGRDTIYDLTASDRIDLHLIDANTTATGNQDFKFIGTKDFSGKAGELRFDKKASDTFIYGDVNGDKKADFAIHLDDALSLKAGYFIL